MSWINILYFTNHDGIRTIALHKNLGWQTLEIQFLTFKTITSFSGILKIASSLDVKKLELYDLNFLKELQLCLSNNEKFFLVQHNSISCCLFYAKDLKVISCTEFNIERIHS